MKRLGLLASVSVFALVVGCSSGEEPNSGPTQAPPSGTAGAAIPQLVERIDVGSDVGGMAIDTESGTAYVANPRGRKLSVVDLKSKNVTETIDMPSYPGEVAVDAENVYVFTVEDPDGNGGELQVVDRGSNDVVGSVEVGRRPRGLVVDGNLAFIPLVDAGEVVVVDVAKRQVVSRVGESGATMSGIALDPATHTVYAADRGQNRVLVIQDNAVVDSISLGATPRAIAFDPTHKRIYVGGQGGSVIIIDAATTQELATVSVDGDPQGLAVSPDGKLAYYVNRNSRVSVVDTEANDVVSTFDIGDSPFGVVVDQSTGTVYFPADGGLDVARSAG